MVVTFWFWLNWFEGVIKFYDSFQMTMKMNNTSFVIKTISLLCWFYCSSSLFITFFSLKSTKKKKETYKTMDYNYKKVDLNNSINTTTTTIISTISTTCRQRTIQYTTLAFSSRFQVRFMSKFFLLLFCGF